MTWPHAPHHLPSQSQYTLGCAWSWQSPMLGLTSSVGHKNKVSLLVKAEKATTSLQAHTVVTQAKEMLYFGAGFLPNFSRPAGRSSEFWNEWNEQVV